MTLPELASELFIYLVIFRRKVAAQISTSAPSVANDLEMIFARMDERAQSDAGLSERYGLDLEASRERIPLRKILAIIADGLVIGSDWEHAFDYRAEHLLENKLYTSNEGGDLFYDWLDRLPAADAEAREIGFTALALGFQGRYARQPEKRTETKRKLYNSLPERVLDVSEKVTPSAYESTDERDCTVPPVAPVLRYLIVFVGLVLFLLVLGNTVYDSQKRGIEDRVPQLTTG